MAKINFPKPATDGQLYPDLDAGDLPLESGKVYEYDAILGVWKIVCDEELSLNGEDPIIVRKDPYQDHITSIVFDPTNLPKITTP